MFISFVQNAALLITLSVFFGVLTWYRPRNEQLFRFLGGLWFGFIAMAAMLIPFEYQPGAIYDGRSVILTLAGLFGGGITAVISMLVAAAFRFYLGGAGVIAGVATIVSCSLIGLSFRRLYKSDTAAIPLYVLFLIGIVTHLVMLACQLLLPSQFSLKVISEIWIPVLLIFPLTFTLIAKLIQLIDQYIVNSRKIRDAEELYRTTLLSIGDAVIIADKNGSIIRMNRVAEQMTGWSFNDAKGKGLSQVFKTLDEKTGVEEPDPTEILIGGKGVTGISHNTILVGKNNRQIPISDTAAPVRDEKGEANGIVLVFRDQTEDRNRQTSLMQSEERFSKSILLAPFPIMLYDEEGKVIHLSAGWTHFSGYTLEDIPTIREWAVKAYGERADEIVKYNLNILDEHRTVESGDYDIIAKNGEIRSWNFFTTPLGRLGDGKRVVLNTASDITDRKSIEKALIEKEEDYRKLFEEHTAAKLLIDPVDGRIVKANKAAAGYYGWSMEQLESMHIDQINTLPEESVREQMRKALDRKGEYFEFKHRRSDGSIRDVEVFTSRITYGGRELLHSIIHDITEKKRFFRELVAAKEKAEESERLKSAFLANMSHEIRTPLNGILGFTNLITEENGLSQSQKYEYAAIIKKSAEGLMKIINDVLEISRLETGKELIAREPFELCRMLQTMYGFYHKKILDTEGKSIELLLKCPNAKIVINSDEVRLTQVLSNLLDNAIKFTMAGKIEFGVSINEKDRLEMFVSDTGIGIPKEKQQVIFERFSQADISVSRNYGGTGLGLAIVRRLVELMGGEIRLDSEPGQGSKFSIIFPMDEHTMSVEEEPQNEKKESGLAVGHILVVEDDKVSRLLMNHMLKSKAALLHFVTSGGEAIQYVRSKHPDIVLMDIGLPDINGLEAVRQIRQFDQNVWIIAQTAYAMADDEREALKAGCNDYMSKPVREDILSKKLQKAMEM